MKMKMNITYLVISLSKKLVVSLERAAIASLGVEGCFY